jgi:hypothetical protein
MEKQKKILRIIALIIVVTVFYHLTQRPLRAWLNWWKLLFYWFQYSVAAHVLIFDLILFLKLIAAYGIFKIKSWGRMIALPVLAVDILFRLYGMINIYSYHLRHPQPSSIPMGQHVEIIPVNLTPSYIISFTSLISIIILMNKRIKTTFINEKND